VRASVVGPAGRPGEVAVSGAANDTVFGRVLVPADPKSVESVTLHLGEVWLEGAFDHPGGTVNLDFNLESVDSVGSAPVGARPEAGMVWISELLVERFPALDIIPRR